MFHFTKKQTIVRNLCFDILGAFLQALGTWCFIEPCGIAPGGASGIALMINYVSGWPVGLLILLINIPLLISSFVLLEHNMTVRTVRTVFIISIVLDLVVSPLFPQFLGDRLIAAVFGGILVGVGIALVFMGNSTTGGGDILAKLLQKQYPYLHTGHAIMIIDFVVIGTSITVFRQMEAAFYGLFSMVCSAYAIDMILYGMNKGTMLTIFSSENKEIADDIMKRLNRGTTYFRTIGGFSGKDGETLMCVVDRKQFYLVKEIVDRHDEHAFVIVSETREVYGEGFLRSGP